MLKSQIKTDYVSIKRTLFCSKRKNVHQPSPYLVHLRLLLLQTFAGLVGLGRPPGASRVRPETSTDRLTDLSSETFTYLVHLSLCLLQTFAGLVGLGRPPGASRVRPETSTDR